jgi:hypothetical protein
MLNSLSPRRTACAASPGEQLFNARPIGSALFNPLFDRGSPPASVVRTDNSGKPILWCHALTLIVRRGVQAFALQLRRDGFCVCLHALSSFQRTDISKRPRRLAHTRVCFDSLSVEAPLARPRQGNFSILLSSLASSTSFWPLLNFLRPNARGCEGATRCSNFGKCRVKPGSVSGDRQQHPKVLAALDAAHRPLSVDSRLLQDNLPRLLTLLSPVNQFLAHDSKYLIEAESVTLSCEATDFRALGNAVEQTWQYFRGQTRPAVWRQQALRCPRSGCLTRRMFREYCVQESGRQPPLDDLDQMILARPSTQDQHAPLNR